MLVLTRKLNQSIMIGEIEVTVMEMRGDQVRLGIQAPRGPGSPQRGLLANPAGE